MGDPNDCCWEMFFFEISRSRHPLYLPLTMPLHISDESLKKCFKILTKKLFSQFHFLILLFAILVSGIITEFSKFRFFHTFSEEFTSWGDADDDIDDEDVRPLVLDWNCMLAAINAIAFVAVDVHEDAFEEQAATALL